MNNVARLALVAMAVGLFACTTAEPPPPPSSPRAAEACPLGVEGARVAVDDSDVGVVLTFTASRDRLGDLRERAADAAEIYGPGQRKGKGHDGRHATGAGHGLQAMTLPPVVAREEDIQGGARIWLAPVDSDDADVLRAKVRERALAMMSSCR